MSATYQQRETELHNKLSNSCTAHYTASVWYNDVKQTLPRHRLILQLCVYNVY